MSAGFIGVLMKVTMNGGERETVEDEGECNCHSLLLCKEGRKEGGRGFG